MMMALYIVILCGSAYFASYAGVRLSNRLLRELDQPRERTQIAIALSLIGFLTVVSAPAGVMTAALLLFMFGMLYSILPPLSDWRGAVPFVAAAVMGVVGITGAPGEFPSVLPDVAWWFIAAAVFLTCLLSARQVTPQLEDFSAAAIAAAFPLSLSPLLFHDAHHSLAVDAGLVSSALLGGIVAATQFQYSTALLRLPTAVILAYGMLQAVRYGAWPLAVVSLLLWVLGMAAAQKHTQGLHR